MPRAFRSPGSKPFRRENVSVPNHTARDASGAGIRGGLKAKSGRGSKAEKLQTSICFPLCLGTEIKALFAAALSSA